MPAGSTIPTNAAARKRRHFENAGRLESFDAGDGGNPVQMRIYDKAAEIRNSHKKWLRDIWGCAAQANVWRVEFQLRRPLLKAFLINTLGRLRHHLAGLWETLTADWASLRPPEPGNTRRRRLHPCWMAVQACAPQFGPLNPLGQRIAGGGAAGGGWR